MKPLAFAASILVAAAALVPACTVNPLSVGHEGGACASAGGTCVLGSVACTTQAPSAAQDCNTNPPNPGGAFCCLALADAGPGPDAGNTCAAAGGQCVGLSPTSCAGGTVLDATTHSCGGGVGVECCLPGSGDGGAGDAGDGGGSSGGTFACGPSLVCDGHTQICHITEGGAVQPDGGFHIGYACEAIPTSCAANVTCACVQPATFTQQCSESTGDVTVTTQAP